MVAEERWSLRRGGRWGEVVAYAGEVVAKGGSTV